ncbi:phosphotransferase [Variovorax sp. RCC_210]|uniref:phosphotransferase n=1 Tax=Variovorax sp. RCC_210 TaxID=3239217 RepID=UPI003523726F
MQDLNTEALAGFIRANVADFAGPLQVSRFDGGQSNPTFGVRAGDARYVLRRKPPGQLLSSAHAVDREYRVMRALAESAVPVPRVHALCEDDAVLGSSFYLMEWVEGRILGDQTLPGIAPAERTRMYAELNRVMAALHAVDWRGIGLADFGKPDHYLERQIARWSRQYRATETGRIEAMEQLLDWLPSHIPPQEAQTSIVHGDFRLDNVVFHPSEPRIVAVLDWELSTLGDPLVDFAYHCMTWRLALGTHRTLAGIDPAALGIPTEEEHVRAYCQRTGREGIAHWHFYLAFNMFRLAAIQQGVQKRALEGNAAHVKALQAGARVEATADMALGLMRAVSAAT